jgi:hypothetical protein
LNFGELSLKLCGPTKRPCMHRLVARSPVCRQLRCLRRAMASEAQKVEVTSDDSRFEVTSGDSRFKHWALTADDSSRTKMASAAASEYHYTDFCWSELQAKVADEVAEKVPLTSKQAERVLGKGTHGDKWEAFYAA